MITVDSISTVQGINDAIQSFRAPFATPVRLALGPIRSELTMILEDGKILVCPSLDAEDLLALLWDRLPEDCETRREIAREIVKKHFKPSDN